MDDRTRWLLEAPLNGVLLKLTAPSTLAFAVQSAVTLAEVWFIGQLGTSALAAMALVFPLLMLVQTMSGGALGGAISASIARSLGAGQRDKAEQLIWHALVTALLGALTFLVVFALGGRSLLVMLGGEAQLLDLAADYCWVLFLGGFSVWASSSLGAVFRGMGLMGFSAMIMILGALIQIPLSGGLILGWFGLPQLGLMGAAVSTISVASLMSLLFVLRLMGNSTPAQLKLGQLQLSRPLFEEILKVARPASLSP
ncbi:MAG: MATE family efflux transporter, partial [Pseudomonadales bacterium]